jgi:hypothetical protein
MQIYSLGLISARVMFVPWEVQLSRKARAK